jgi:hypothetical protein
MLNNRPSFTNGDNYCYITQALVVELMGMHDYSGTDKQIDVVFLEEKDVILTYCSRPDHLDNPDMKS